MGVGRHGGDVGCGRDQLSCGGMELEVTAATVRGRLGGGPASAGCGVVTAVDLMERRAGAGALSSGPTASVRSGIGGAVGPRHDGCSSQTAWSTGIGPGPSPRARNAGEGGSGRSAGAAILACGCPAAGAVPPARSPAGSNRRGTISLTSRNGSAASRGRSMTGAGVESARGSGAREPGFRCRPTSIGTGGRQPTRRLGGRRRPPPSSGRRRISHAPGRCRGGLVALGHRSGGWAESFMCNLQFLGGQVG